MSTRRLLLSALLAPLPALLAGPGAQAQAGAAWPAQPVKMLLSQPAGSGPDNIARLLAERLQRAWGQTVVVDNKPGGQNTIGAQAAARAPADGYTLYFATAAALVTNKYLFKTLPYDPVKDFVPVSFVGHSPFVLVVTAESPFKSWAELQAAAKARAGAVSIANEGPRTFGGIATRLLAARAGVDFNQVAYPAVGVALQNLMGGHVQAALVDVASSAQLVRQGKLRFLAVTAPRRVPGWDAVPTLAESLPGYDMVGWLAVVAPRGTPAEALNRASRDIAAALADKDLAERIHAIGPHTEGAGGTPEQLATWLAEEHARFARVAAEINLLPE